MKTYIVDSDILIDFFKKIPEAVTLIEQLGEIGNNVISVISIAELRSGWSEKEASIYLKHLYNLLGVISVTKDIAEKAVYYREKYRIKGVKLPLVDTFIAATAIVHNACLVTRNIKHYPMREVEIYPRIYGIKPMIIADLRKTLIQTFPNKNIIAGETTLTIKQATTSSFKIIPEEINTIVARIGEIYRLRKSQMVWSFYKQTNELTFLVNLE